MKRPVSVLIALGVMAAMLVALAAPALANHRDFFDNDEDCFFFDGVLICDEDFDRDDFDGDRFDNFDGFGGEIDQDVEQEAESGDIDQSFDVSQTGDNSNQCVSTQGVANTGNAQNVIDLTQVDGDADDFEFDEVDSSIEVSPTNTTECTSEVNQAASASG